VCRLGLLLIDKSAFPCREATRRRPRKRTAGRARAEGPGGRPTTRRGRHDRWHASSSVARLRIAGAAPIVRGRSGVRQGRPEPPSQVPSVPKGQPRAMLLPVRRFVGPMTTRAAHGAVAPRCPPEQAPSRLRLVRPHWQPATVHAPTRQSAGSRPARGPHSQAAQAHGASHGAPAHAAARSNARAIRNPHSDCQERSGPYGVLVLESSSHGSVRSRVLDAPKSLQQSRSSFSESHRGSAVCRFGLF
jgi:hypothetical protein